MNNFYLLRQLSIPFLLVVLTTSFSLAQPCGIDAKIKILGGTATCGYFADTSGYQPGWIGYKYEWKVNDDLPFNSSALPAIMYDQLGAGFNRIQLTVYATNPTTGDSCIDTYTNIFQATGDAIYPEFDVTVNGNTVTVNGNYRGGPYNFNVIDIIYDFGDGTQSTSNSLTESHTYANAGTKTIVLSVNGNNMSNGLTAYGANSRSVNIGTGVTNMQFSSIMNNTICDSVSLYAFSSVPFQSGSVRGNYYVPGNTVVNGTYTPISMAEVPGHDFLIAEGYGVNVGSDSRYHLVTLNDCGIIPDTISGFVFEDLNFNGIREAGEPGIAGKTISVYSTCDALLNSSIDASYSTTTDTAGYYTILVPHFQVRIEFNKPSGYTLTYPQNNYYNVSFSSGTMHTGFDFGISALSVNLCGITYLDDNNDSLFNFNERRLENTQLTATNTTTGFEYRTYSNSTGNYCFELPPGNFEVRPVNWPIDSATYTPDSLLVNAGTGGNFNGRNFGFRSSTPTDFDLRMYSSTEARPGFNYELSTRIINKGFVKGKGEVVCTYDPILVPVSADPSSGIINTVAHTITWTTDSIDAGRTVYFSGNFTIPASTPLGTLLSLSSVITPLSGTIENNLTNNNINTTQTIIGSFDPNDKAVFPAGFGATGDVLHDTPFDYRIRFQNTGTASAINVFVADTIDDDLDLNTLVIHRASHNYDLVINGNVLTWRFFNINLPDSNTNEPASHGFIEYSISPKAGLTDGTTIENTAYIYFDFNAPVVTNTTLNTMLTSLESIEEIPSTQKLLAYPNPGSTKIFVLPRVEINGRTEILLFDITGKQVQRIYNGNYTKGQTIEADVEDLAKGMYMIEMRYNGGTENIKWIKQ